MLLFMEFKSLQEDNICQLTQHTIIFTCAKMVKNTEVPIVISLKGWMELNCLTMDNTSININDC